VSDVRREELGGGAVGIGFEHGKRKVDGNQISADCIIELLPCRRRWPRGVGRTEPAETRTREQTARQNRRQRRRSDRFQERSSVHQPFSRSSIFPQRVVCRIGGARDMPLTKRPALLDWLGFFGSSAGSSEAGNQLRGSPFAAPDTPLSDRAAFGRLNRAPHEVEHLVESLPT